MSAWLDLEAKWHGRQPARGEAESDPVRGGFSAAETLPQERKARLRYQAGLRTVAAGIYLEGEHQAASVLTRKNGHHFFAMQTDEKFRLFFLPDGNDCRRCHQRTAKTGACYLDVLDLNADGNGVVPIRRGETP
jgi:hypothetical protein